MIYCMVFFEYVEKRFKDLDNIDFGFFEFFCERFFFLKKKINFIVKFSIFFFQYIQRCFFLVQVFEMFLDDFFIVCQFVCVKRSSLDKLLV